jgi:hypothetical protein
MKCLEFLLRLIYEPDAPKIAGIGVHCVSLPEQSNNKVRIIPSAKRLVLSAPDQIHVLR